MDNQKQSPLNVSRETTSPIDEEKLWDLEDDWDDEPTTTLNRSVDLTTPPQPSSNDTPFEHQFSPSSDDIQPHNTDDIEDIDISEDNAVDHASYSKSPLNTPPIVHQVESLPAQSTNSDSDTPETTTPQKTTNEDSTKKTTLSRISTIEKIFLALIILLFLGLGVSSYIWLYKKNITTDHYAVDLPIEGQFVHINHFSTYWKSPEKNDEHKIGAIILPSATITLSPNTPKTAALRIFFHNQDDQIIGDPITLPIENGVFKKQNNPNIKITKQGLTAEITCSDGFHEEGDYNAYVLDKDIYWNIYLLEAPLTQTSGKDFKQLIKTRIIPRRK